ncbi:MAG TPA: tetraacyldisaccharide 4'-kinase [candidate division Zixibacteria bacterium]|nr:tetraacyldisaccharide 4'-kinase [candidate division Zixibacteria bacterium]
MRALLLLPLSAIYYIIYIIWNIYWQKKKSVKINANVISIGNITVGGAGKTSIAGHLAEALLARGKKVALVARGFGRPEKAPVIVYGGEETDWRKCGDEPAILARTIKGLSIYVDSNKTEAAIKAAHDGFEYIIIDDGFQHRNLARVYDIVCLDGKNPFGNGLLLPSGRLREPKKALRRANAIILIDPGSNSIKLPTAVPVFQAHKKIIGIKSLTGEPVDLTGKKVIGFCGLGNPESFHSSLETYGCQIAEFMPFPDHHIYDEGDIFEISKRVCLSEAVGAVTTLKDLVKLEQLWPADISLHYLEIVIELDNESEFYKLLGL